MATTGVRPEHVPVNPMPRHALVLEDLPEVAAWLQALLAQRFSGIQVERAGTLAEARRRLQDTVPPDLALVDLGLPGMRGTAGILELCAAHPALPVLIVTGRYDQWALAKNWRHCPNVRGVVHKGAGVEPLRAAIDLALDNPLMAWLPTGAVAMPTERVESAAAPLTLRQREVARAAIDGLSNREIAVMLGLTEGTVKNHLHHVFRVLGVSNRTQLASRLRTMGQSLD